MRDAPIDLVLQGKGPAVPSGGTTGNLFAGLVKSRPYSRLVICRPFLPAKDTDNDYFHYYFVDDNALDKVSIAAIVKNYSHTIIEKKIYRRDIAFFQSLETICIPGGNFVSPNENKLAEPRLTFLVSSDTHADFMTRIAGHFREVQYIIPALRCKDDRAAEALAEKGLEYIELDYNAEACPALKTFAPDFIFCGADWTSEFFAIARIAGKLTIPIVTLQEGPQDWNMRLVQSIKGNKVLRILNHYRNADILFSQGALTLNYIRPKYFAVTGNPKIDRITGNPLPAEPTALINCNFTYIASKPAYENNRDMWLRDAVSACEEAGIDYFISQHPRDDGKLEYAKVIDSCASVIKEQLLKASIVISRFSSIPYEALAQGREAIYYNPHREPMLDYTADLNGAVKLAADKPELRDFLVRHKKRMVFDKKKAGHYLSQHCGPMDGRAGDRIIGLFKSFPNHSFNHDRLMENLKSHPGLIGETVNFPGKKLNIAVFSRNSATEYSGGRYYSYALAEALSYAGHKVFYITENLPVFYPDFAAVPTHQDVEICLTTNFADNLPGYPMDIVILVPGLDRYREYYLHAVAFARKNNAHQILLNFETPNWYNELSPVGRDRKLWKNWELAGRYSSLILSSTAEGRKYARQYYKKVPAGARFAYAYPPINTYTADKVISKDIKKEKRILMIVRYSLAHHKGCFNLPDILCEAMGGYTLVLIVGTGTVPDDIDNEIRDKAKQWGIGLDYKYKPTDYEKFMEMQKACLLLFPSFFEGYGYPPVEALYFNTPCIAFELPVLQETCKDVLIFVPRGDWQAFKEKINEVLKDTGPVRTREKITPVAKFDLYAKKLHTLVTALAERDLPGELSKFQYKREVKRENLSPKKTRDPKTNTLPGRLVKAVSRFIRNRFSYRRYEQVRHIYRKCLSLLPGKRNRTSK